MRVEQIKETLIFRRLSKHIHISCHLMECFDFYLYPKYHFFKYILIQSLKFNREVYYYTKYLTHVWRMLSSYTFFLVKLQI